MSRLGTESPVLLAEPTGEGQWRVWCPFCHHYHVHGMIEGHRSAHCGSGSPFHETGYYIMLRSEAERRLAEEVEA